MKITWKSFERFWDNVLINGFYYFSIGIVSSLMLVVAYTNFKNDFNLIGIVITIFTFVITLFISHVRNAYARDTKKDKILFYKKEITTFLKSTIMYFNAAAKNSPLQDQNGKIFPVNEFLKEHSYIQPFLTLEFFSEKTLLLISNLKTLIKNTTYFQQGDYERDILLSYSHTILTLLRELLKKNSDQILRDRCSILIDGVELHLLSNILDYTQEEKIELQAKILNQELISAVRDTKFNV